MPAARDGPWEQAQQNQRAKPPPAESWPKASIDLCYWESARWPYWSGCQPPRKRRARLGESEGKKSDMRVFRRSGGRGAAGFVNPPVCELCSSSGPVGQGEGLNAVLRMFAVGVELGSSGHGRAPVSAGQFLPLVGGQRCQRGSAVLLAQMFMIPLAPGVTWLRASQIPANPLIANATGLLRIARPRHGRGLSSH